MSWPPRHYRLSRCLCRVLRDSLRLSRWGKNDLKHSTICRPGNKSTSSYIQLVGHQSRSGQYTASSSSADAASAHKMTSDPVIVLDLAAMRLITLLNRCHHFPGFVYEKARLCRDQGIVEIEVQPRRGAKPVCSGCHRPAVAYDDLGVRRFEFVPLWVSSCRYFAACGAWIARLAACALKNCRGHRQAPAHRAPHASWLACRLSKPESFVPDR
jgi:hypothetical protein